MSKYVVHVKAQIYTHAMVGITKDHVKDAEVG
jgi:hypothetical protein